MKAAWIARVVVLAMTLALAGTLFAVSASAAPLSKKLNIDSDELAVDGTDVYSAIARRSKSSSDVLVVYRSSLLNKSRVEIARFPGSSGGNVDGFSAGGGYLVLSLNDERFSSANKKGIPTSTVWRIARDGSNKELIATGRIVTDDRGYEIVENGIPYMNDCGTSVDAFGVTAAGSVVMSSVVSDRRSKACGRKKDVDHWRFYELRLDGTEREIFAKDQVVKMNYKRRNEGREFDSTTRDSPVSSLELVGDRALIRSDSSGSYFVRNLLTGSLSGPFGSAGRSREKIEIASLSANGAVAMNTFLLGRRGFGRERIGIFPDSTDPAVFKERKGDSPLAYCGSHLLSIPNSPDAKLEELDPLTFATKRVLAKTIPYSYIAFGIELACDDNYMYAIDFGGSDAPKLLAYPLD